MGTAQTPPDHREGHPSPLLQRRMVASHHRDRTVQPGQGRHHTLPLPGSSHPGPMASQRMNHHGNPKGTCGEPGAGTTGTPGSGGDSGKPTGRNTGRAPRVDLTPLQARSVRRRGLSFRFSGGFAGPGESTTVQLSGPYGVSAFVGVQDRPHVSRVVVSKALARSTSSQ